MEAIINELVRDLEGIEIYARATQEALRAGTAKNGFGALRRIEEKASDAARHAKARLNDVDPVTEEPR